MEDDGGDEKAIIGVPPRIISSRGAAEGGGAVGGAPVGGGVDASVGDHPRDASPPVVDESSPRNEQEDGPELISETGRGRSGLRPPSPEGDSLPSTSSASSSGGAGGTPPMLPPGMRSDMELAELLLGRSVSVADVQRLRAAFAQAAGVEAALDPGGTGGEAVGRLIGWLVAPDASLCLRPHIPCSDFTHFCMFTLLPTLASAQTGWKQISKLKQVLESFMNGNSGGPAHQRGGAAGAGKGSGGGDESGGVGGRKTSVGGRRRSSLKRKLILPREIQALASTSATVPHAHRAMGATEQGLEGGQGGRRSQSDQDSDEEPMRVTRLDLFPPCPSSHAASSRTVPGTSSSAASTSVQGNNTVAESQSSRSRSLKGHNSSSPSSLPNEDAVRAAVSRCMRNIRVPPSHRYGRRSLCSFICSCKTILDAGSAGPCMNCVPPAPSV